MPVTYNDPSSQSPTAILDLRNPVALVMLDDKDKTLFVAEQIQRLAEANWAICGTKGTVAFLKDNGVSTAIDVKCFTGHEPAMGHKMASCSWETSCQLISYQEDRRDIGYLNGERLPPYQLLVCTAYGLEEEIHNPDSTWLSRRDKTDFGGPAALRAAAKGRRAIVFRLDQLERVINRLLDHDVTSGWLEEMAAEAESFCAQYSGLSAANISRGALQFLRLRKEYNLRYGENPYQKAALWSHEDGHPDPLAIHRWQITSPERMPSAVNLTDVHDALFILNLQAAVSELNQLHDHPVMGTVVKHGTAVGLAMDRDDPLEVIERVFAGNPEAEYGGIAMFNFPITGELADAILHRFLTSDRKFRFLWGVAGPTFDDEARKLLLGKQVKKLLIENPALANIGLQTLDVSPEYIPLRGTVIIQDGHRFLLNLEADYLKFEGQPLEMYTDWIDDLVIAWTACAGVKSNSTTGANNGVLVGVGTGNVSRVDSCIAAVRQAGDRAKEATFVTDNFFPEEDGLRVLLDAGARLVMATRVDNKEERNARLAQMAQEAGCIYLTVPEEIGRIFYGHK